jgi:prevent-host-death family protein
VQNNFGKYLKYAQANKEIVITRKGRDTAKLVPCDTAEETSALYMTEGSYTTYEEFIELVESSEQYFELIDGVIYNMASPSYSHQQALREIFVAFYSWFKDKKCEPVSAPFNVTLIKDETNICVVAPDIIIICDNEKIDENDKYKGVPTLVVEILSPTTRSKDMIKKFDLYKQCGIKEYWIVDTKGEQIYLYLFTGNEIAENKVFLAGTHKYVESSFFKGLQVELSELF